MSTPRRALVLGAGGFLGSHLTRGLLERGWDVTAIVRDPTEPHIQKRLEGVLGDVEMVAGDATDPELLAGLVTGRDAVFPFAGHSGAARSLQHPVDDAAANAAGQLAVLEALRRHAADARVVFPGSRLQYGRVHHIPVDEGHPQDPTSIYGLHKMVGERYHLLYHQLFGLGTCCLRISNPYGPHQDRPDRSFGVVGTFMALAAQDAPIPLYGGGRQLREYVYVDDLVDLVITAAIVPHAVGRVFNAGGADPVSLRQMAQAVLEVVGGGRVVDAGWPPIDAAVETGDYVGDVTLVRRVLGWQPRISLRRGLAATWAASRTTLAPQVSEEI